MPLISGGHLVIGRDNEFGFVSSDLEICPAQSQPWGRAGLVLEIGDELTAVLIDNDSPDLAVDQIELVVR